MQIESAFISPFLYNKKWSTMYNGDIADWKKESINSFRMFHLIISNVLMVFFTRKERSTYFFSKLLLI